MQLMRISLKSLTYLSTAIDKGSLKQAAAELCVVPSAIAAAINSVEEELQLKLITRFPARGIAATETGKIIMRRVDALIDNYNELIEEGASIKNSLNGTFRIAFVISSAPAFMPALVRPIIKGQFQVKLALTETNNEQAQPGLLSGDYDAILFHRSDIKPGFSHKTLLEAHPYVLAPSNFFPKSTASVRMAGLDEKRIVLLDLPVVSEYYQSLFDVAGIKPLIVATAQTTAMVHSLVGSVMGCSILNFRGNFLTSYAGEAAKINPIKDATTPSRLMLGYKTEYKRKLTQTFIDRCQEYFNSSGSEQYIVRSDLD